MTAQGEALGFGGGKETSPVRAARAGKMRSDALAGLAIVWGAETQGFTLGYHIAPFQGGEQRVWQSVGVRCERARRMFLSLLG